MARSLVESGSTDGGLRVQRSRPERLSDQAVSPLAIEAIGPHGCHRPNRRGPGDGQEQGHFAEVASPAQRPDPIAVPGDLDLAGADGVEGVARVPLADDLVPRL